MAIYYTDKSRSFGPAIGQASPGTRVEVVAEAIVDVTTAMIDNANDEVGLFWLPKGAVITSAGITATDMDSGTTLAFDVGDDSDEDRIFAASNVGQAGTVSFAMARTAFLYKYTARTLIKAYVQAAATGAAAGTLYVWVRYFVDEGYSTTSLTASTTA